MNTLFRQAIFGVALLFFSQVPALSAVFHNASHRHPVAGAQMALALGPPVSIVADASLPIRGGSCEITYFDVPAAP
jgi:hypothetical protein